MALNIQSWLLQQMNTEDSLDAVTVTIKLAVRQFGAGEVAGELRRIADRLERYGDLPGWKFPSRQSDR